MTLSVKQQNILRIILATLVGLAFVFELIRDCQRDGDFMGYVNAGNAVINHTPIYADYLNTWPPFFAIFSVPLAWVHSISPVLIRLIWLIGIIVSWFFIAKWTVRITMDSNVSLKRTSDPSTIWLLDWRIFLPFLFVLRFVIDDLSNIQINSFILLACLYAIHCFMQGKQMIAGIVLGVIISLKVYPIFLLFFFVYKRAYKLSLVTLMVIGLTILISFLIFGYDVGVHYYSDWIHNKAMGDTILTHKNQSLFPWFDGLLTNQSRGLDITYNVFNLSASISKKITYVVVGLAAISIGWLFRKSTNRYHEAGQFAFVLAAIPILSPLAWKYYFVFLFPLIFVVFNTLYKNPNHSKWSMRLFIVAIALAILSTDGLLGVWFSDVLEVFGCVTWATFLLLLSYLLQDNKETAMA